MSRFHVHQKQNGCYQPLIGCFSTILVSASTNSESNKTCPKLDSRETLTSRNHCQIIAMVLKKQISVGCCRKTCKGNVQGVGGNGKISFGWLQDQKTSQSLAFFVFVVSSFKIVTGISSEDTFPTKQDSTVISCFDICCISIVCRQDLLWVWRNWPHIQKLYQKER